MSIATKSDKKNFTERLILCMGIAYLFFLVWAILWKCGRPFIGDGTERAINFLPFNDNTSWEMQFNIAVFAPFGFYLSSAMQKKTAVIKQVLAIFIVSVLLEIVQFVLAIGKSDITDLLMNTLGGAIGIAAFYVLSKLLVKNERRLRKVTLVVCVLMTLFELYMTVSFILFGHVNIGYMVIR